MNTNLLTSSPFGILTFIAAPALLTNASCVLAMSTVNRMLRTRDRMHEMLKESESGNPPHGKKFLEQVERVEKQAIFQIGALHWIYIALGSFAGASLVTLLGAAAAELGRETIMRAVVVLGLLLAITGVSGLIGGCFHLFKANQLSLAGIRQEVDLIRAKQATLKDLPDNFD